MSNMLRKPQHLLDIENLQDQIDRINQLLASDDLSLDTLQEVVDFVKNNSQTSEELDKKLQDVEAILDGILPDIIEHFDLEEGETGFTFTDDRQIQSHMVKVYDNGLPMFEGEEYTLDITNKMISLDFTIDSDDVSLGLNRFTVVTGGTRKSDAHEQPPAE